MADEDARLNEDLRRKPAFIERVHLADVILNPKLVKTLYPTASGGVVVASRHAGLVDAVKDGETGFLVAPGDVDGWVKTITMIADCSPEQRTAFIKEAKEKCETYYSWTRVAADTARSYDEPSKGS